MTSVRGREQDRDSRSLRASAMPYALHASSVEVQAASMRSRASARGVLVVTRGVRLQLAAPMGTVTRGARLTQRCLKQCTRRGDGGRSGGERMRWVVGGSCNTNKA